MLGAQIFNDATKCNYFQEVQYHWRAFIYVYNRQEHSVLDKDVDLKGLIYHS